MIDPRQTVLITGAAGFIGGHVVRLLAGDGDRRRVIALVRPGTAVERLDGLRREGAEPVEGDIADHGAVGEVFSRHRPDRVVHLAALRGAGRGGEADYRRVNTEGTETLLSHAAGHGVKRFVHCSSVGVHGTIPGELPATIDTPFHGDSAYHRSKIDAEAAVVRHAGQELDTCIIRPAITYGPGDDGFPATLVSLVRRRRFPKPRHDVLVHLLDVAALGRLIRALLDSPAPGRRTIIAADLQPVHLSALVDAIHRRYHGRDYPRFLFLPRSAARLLASVLGAAGADAWRTRVRLISESWYFTAETGDLAAAFDPPDTLTAFPERMCR